jgi:ATP-dependent Clp protease adaptor protein ClpS
MSDTDSAVITRPETREERETRRVPPYNVILLNDDDHSMEFVVMVLMKVLGYEIEKCVQLMLQAHTSGRAVVWSGPKEVAELKVEQIHTFHEMKGAKDIGAVGCEIEPAA